MSKIFAKDTETVALATELLDGLNGIPYGKHTVVFGETAGRETFEVTYIPGILPELDVFPASNIARLRELARNLAEVSASADRYTVDFIRDISRTLDVALWRYSELPRNSPLSDTESLGLERIKSDIGSARQQLTMLSRMLSAFMSI